VIGTAIRIVAIGCCLIIVVSFGEFVSDEAAGASRHQVVLINSEAVSQPSAEQQRLRDKAHGSIGGFFDDANDTLLSPFAGAVSSGSAWVQRGVPALLGLLIYGAGLGVLGRFVRMR
jgi:hypothetical protein